MSDQCLVTGGAGFIGSHLIDYLMRKGYRCIVIDNLSSGSLKNIERWINHGDFKFIRGDLLNPSSLKKYLKNCKHVFHLAANPEVRVSAVNPEVHYKQNVQTTFNLLELIRREDSVEKLAFTSSSTVYGDAELIPTPETHPIKPISIYGASKAACEVLIQAYAKTYGFKAVIYRLANIIGSRSKHGVIHDFILKLRRNENELEILGDGNQRKSYLYISDCIDAMIKAFNAVSGVEVYNVGSEDWVTVKEIAEAVCREMGLSNVKFKFTGGVDGGRGWIGDVKLMLLNVEKIKSIGWKPRYNSLEAVKLAIRDLMNEI